LSQVTQEFELYLVNVNLEALPKPLIQKSSPYFQNLLLVDLQNNDLVEIEANFCQNLPNLLELDLRNNKISNVSEHIKALMNLKVLRLDNNQLKVLVPEVG
jgi:Leucine-rich repeat (LRR) protein